MRLIVKILLISCLLAYIGYGEYLIFGKKAEYTAPHLGNVIHSYESSGKYSSTCFATVSFDNGDVQEVNTGHYLYNVGDRFNGSLEWNPIFGVCGFAYAWHPPEWQMIFTMGAVIFNICLSIGLVIGIFRYAFGSNKKDHESH